MINKSNIKSAEALAIRLCTYNQLINLLDCRRGGTKATLLSDASIHIVGCLFMETPVFQSLHLVRWQQLHSALYCFAHKFGFPIKF